MAFKRYFLPFVLALTCLVSIGAVTAIRWFTDNPQTATPAGSMVIPIQVTGPNAYRYMLLSDLKPWMNGNTEPVSYMYVTNIYVTTNYIFQNYSTNLTVFSNSYFYETNFIAYNYTTNLYVTSNAYFFNTNFVNVSFTTNLYASNFYSDFTYVTNLYATTNFFDYTYITNLYATTNFFDYTYITNLYVSNIYNDFAYITNLYSTTNFFDYTYITNLYSTTNFFDYTYITNLYVTYMEVQYITNVNYAVITNLFSTNIYANRFYANYVTYSGAFPTTNKWSGPSNTLDMSVQDQNYTTLTPMEITGLVNKSNTVTESVLLSLLNSSGSNVTLYFPADVITGDGASSYTVTNGVPFVISVRYTPVFGGWTNMVKRDFW